MDIHKVWRGKNEMWALIPQNAPGRRGSVRLATDPWKGVPLLPPPSPLPPSSQIFALISSQCSFLSKYTHILRLITVNCLQLIS